MQPAKTDSMKKREVQLCKGTHGKKNSNQSSVKKKPMNSFIDGGDDRVSGSQRKHSQDIFPKKVGELLARSTEKKCKNCE